MQKKVFVFTEIPPRGMYNRKICLKMITSIIRYHTGIYYIMSITRDRFRPYWVSSGGCKKHSILNMLKKQICHWVQKNAIQNNMIQQYLYHWGHIQGHTPMTWTTSHIGKQRIQVTSQTEECSNMNLAPVHFLLLLNCNTYTLKISTYMYDVAYCYVD